MLDELVPENIVQQDLFNANQIHVRTSELMDVLDAINRKMGRSTIKLASEGFKRPWRMKQGNKSPHFMTQWSDVLSVN
jgi:DNA polymerase V